MTAQTRTLPSEVVEFSSGNNVFEKLDRGWVYRELYFELYGEVNISTAGTADTNPMSPEAIIKRLRLRRNNTNDWYSVDFHALAQFSRIFFPTTTRVGYQSIDPTVTGNQPFQVYLIVPLWQPQVAKPLEWALNAIQATDLRLEVQWGTIGDLVGDAVATFDVEPQLTVHKYVHTGGGVPPHRGWRLTNMVKETIENASSNLRLELTPGEMYRGFLIRTLANNGAGVQAPARSVLNRLSLMSGSETFWEVREKDLAFIAPIRKDQDQVVDGIYFWDLLGDGYATEGLDTRGWQDISLKADVNAPAGAQIDVFPIEMLPNRQRNQGQGGDRQAA